VDPGEGMPDDAGFLKHADSDVSPRHTSISESGEGEQGLCRELASAIVLGIHAPHFSTLVAARDAWHGHWRLWQRVQATAACTPTRGMGGAAPRCMPRVGQARAGAIRMSGNPSPQVRINPQSPRTDAKAPKSLLYTPTRQKELRI
jgi:hypothetical protein